MELHLLRIFCAVAEERSLTRAARRLNYVQSNVSARLKQLEDELGCTLFSRTRKGMFLTEHGEKLLPFAQEMLTREQEIRQELKADPGSDTITFGLPETYVRTYLAAPLGRWLADHPQSTIRIKTGFSPQIVQYLEKRLVDIGVVISRKQPANLYVLKEIKAELCVVTPLSIKSLDDRQMAGLQPMLLGDSCFFGQALLHLCNDLGLIGKEQAHLFSIETILQCVALGLGVSVLPTSLLAGHPIRDRLNLHEYPGKKTFSYFKVCLPDRAQSVMVARIADCF